MSTTDASADSTIAPIETNEATVQDFTALGLGPEILRAITELGYGAPTPIQAETIPLLLAGRDVVGQAPTGTGKTAAFGLPIIEHLDEHELAPQALIIVPTRELAIQVSEAMMTLGKYRPIITIPIYGGQPYERQLRALARGVQVVVGTPGRLLDHLNRKTLKLNAVRTVVLDEADEMLDMGFIEDIEAILAGLPETHQSALFSATIPPRISRLAEQYLHQPAHVSVASREAIAPRVHQVYYEVPGQAKMDALATILDLEEPNSAIIFVRTRMAADEVCEKLNGFGYPAQAIHGEISQTQREKVLDRFRAGRTQLLVATDVAARGLDIPEVSHIINYDLPLDAESYVHRIGRTGRAGRAGEALTLVTPREFRQLRMIEHAIHRRLQRLWLPTAADIANRRRAAFREEVLRILDAGQLDPYLALVEDLAGTRDATEIAAAAFKMATQAREATRPNRDGSWVQSGTTPAPAATTERGPAPRGRKPFPERTETTELAANTRAETPEDTSADAAPFPVREARPPRRKRLAETTTEGEMTRLMLHVGRQHGVRPADIVGAISNEAGIPGDAIGDIDIYDVFSFVELPASQVDLVRGALSRTTIRGQKTRARLASATDLQPLLEGERPRPSERRGGDMYRAAAPTPRKSTTRPTKARSAPSEHRKGARSRP
jgi:ATP-dependent RNA helicase DeaD